MSGEGFELGWVDERVIRKHAFPPADDTRVFVCGVPDVYKSLCGPRGEKELKPGTALDLVGYSTETVIKF
jgi:hypothetical protein